MAMYDPYDPFLPRVPRRQQSPAVYLWPLALALIVAAFLVGRFWPTSAPGLDPAAQPRTPVTAGPLPEGEKAVIDLYRASAPSVVNVTSSQLVRDRFSYNLFRIPKGTGTGFVWDDEGRIVTNYHVVQHGTEFRVTLSDRTTWKATVIAAEPNMDLAVLAVEAPRDRLRPIPLGRSSEVQVGQQAFAIGNPFGLDQSLSPGYVSALNREIESPGGRTIKGVIQTTAPINPGNSGGPLLDSYGRLIGVNTAIVSPSGAWAGIGFAIPADDVNRVVTELIRGRHGRAAAL